MTHEELSVPPTEREIAEVVDVHPAFGMTKPRSIIRRLAYQRDMLQLASQLHTADIAAVEALNAELREACELLLHVAENGITHVIDVMPAVDAARAALARSSTGAP